MARKPVNKKTPAKKQSGKRAATRNSGRPNLDARPVDSKPPSLQKSRWGAVVRWIAILGIWSSLFVSAILAYYAWDLPDLEKLETPSRRPSVTILASDNSVVATYGDLHAGAVRFNEVPPYLIQAIIATEDRRFFDHFGVDVFGIARAAITNLMAGRVRQGGSTLTQQLAKNLFLTPERSLGRKIQELLLAFWLEARFTKKQILTIYLNRVYLGAGTYGVGAAARRYFGKTIRQVSLRESAILAGLLKAPTRYSPFRNKKLGLKRADQVLANMVAAAFLTKRDAAAASKERLRFAGRSTGSGARYFADWLLERAASFVGRTDRDLVIKSTLTPRLQKIAEDRVSGMLARVGGRRNVGQAALVSLAPNGAIRAMVGGRRYAASQFNRVTQAFRQPGSAFKLFVYLAALEAGMRPDDVIVDSPISIKGWTPRNYSGRYLGRITLRQALAKSVNTAAVKVSEKVGRHRVVKAAERLGITSKLKGHPSIALGAGEANLLDMTAAYAVFANRGFAAWPYGIIEIRDGANQLLYRRSSVGAGTLVRAQTVVGMQEMLREVVTTGTGRRARLGRPAAGKTGTSQGFRDAWFIGFTAELVTGVWLGNDNSAPMKKVSGGSLPATLWKRFMEDALKGTPVRRLPQP
ncbi:MAG: PBP1A family penicillin-binding protein [Alphaproteobacteria bacterium]|nr:PBP1A family penicillin-binding protein [Alphaproteobacteria bacterium]